MDHVLRTRSRARRRPALEDRQGDRSGRTREHGMNMEKSFVKVARFSDIAEGKSARVSLGDDEIALWRVRGKLYAIGNVCSHQHFSELHRGILSGLTVACPMHGWTYS